MNSLTTQSGAIAQRLIEHAADSRGAYAPATERALRSDVAIFTGWCAGMNRKALPASFETVAAFVDAMAELKKPATVRRYVSSVATFHRAAELANPCDSQKVKLALKRMHREHKRDQQQAQAITDHVVVRMLTAAGRRLRDLRDKALLVTAYTTMCRRSELVALRREDLQIDSDGFGTVAILSSKGDQEGCGDVAAITPDAMAHLQAWLETAKIETGPLFRSVRKGRYSSIGGPLGAGDVAVIFKRMAVRARLKSEEVAHISGHSTRVGAAQDMIRYEADMAGAMQAGRWKSPEMLARYTRRVNVRRGAVAKVAGKREQFV